MQTHYVLLGVAYFVGAATGIGLTCLLAMVRNPDDLPANRDWPELPTEPHNSQNSPELCKTELTD